MDTPTFQLMATLFAAISSGTIAAIAIHVAYRHYWGRPPIVVIPGFKRREGVHGKHLFVSYEIWNRLKYPIQVNWQFIRFDPKMASEERFSERYEREGDWLIGSRSAMYVPQVLLTSNDRLKMELSWPLRKHPFSIHDHLVLEVWLFDPMSEKTIKMIQTSSVILTEDEAVEMLLTPRTKKDNKLN